MTGILNAILGDFLLKIIFTIVHWVFSLIIGVLGSLIMTIGEYLFSTVIDKGGILDFDLIMNGINNVFLAKNIDMQSIIYTIALFTLFLTILGTGIKIMASTFGGKETDSPIQFFSRLVIAAVLLGFYSYITTAIAQIFGGILNTAAIFNNDNSTIKTTLESFVGLFKATADTGTSVPDWITSLAFDLIWHNIAQDIIVVIFIFTLFKDMFGAALTFVERVIQFAIYMAIGPICIAFYPYKETSSVTKEWFMGIVSQILVIYVSCLCLNAFYAQLKAMAFGGVGLFN